jgi:hypothetical protein
MNETPKGNYTFDPPITRYEWLAILEFLEEHHPQIRWSRTRNLLDFDTINEVSVDTFGGTTEVYGISIDSRNVFRTMGNDSWHRLEAYRAMNGMAGAGQPKDGREFFGLDFSDDFFDMFESDIKRIIREEIDSDWDWAKETLDTPVIKIKTKDEFI